MAYIFNDLIGAKERADQAPHDGCARVIPQRRLLTTANDKTLLKQAEAVEIRISVD